jgi:DNA-binding SARP family transcriptional activator
VIVQLSSAAPGGTHTRLALLGPIGLIGPTGPLLRRAFQQRRIALLAVLAASPDTTISRDRLLGLLWPDRDERTARHLLADSLYVLRQALGSDSIVAVGESLRLSPRLVTADVVAFRQAVTDERWGDALALYRGDFLDGFFVRNATDFDQWALAERTRLRDLALRAALTWTRALESAGRISDAIRAVERALEFAPLDETVFRDLVKLLIASGNRVRAELLARDFIERLRDELGIAPSAQTMRLVRGARPTADRPADSTTRSLIAQGRYHWHQRTRRSIDRAITYLTRAVERDRHSAEAWSGLADSWLVLGGRGYIPRDVALERGTTFAMKSLAIDDTLAAAHVSLGGVHIVGHRWEDAAASLRRAVALDPHSADARHWLSLALLSGFGARDEAIREQATAAILNPVSPVQISSLGWQRYLRREYELARSAMEPALDLSSEIEEAPAGLARAAARLGDEKTVMTTIAAGLSHRAAARGDLLAEQASALAVLGDVRHARQIALEAAACNAMPINLALAWASLGDVDAALDALSRESFGAYWMPHAVWWDPRFEVLRDDARFKRVRERVEQVWRPEFDTTDL